MGPDGIRLGGLTCNDWRGSLQKKNFCLMENQKITWCKGIGVCVAWKKNFHSTPPYRQSNLFIVWFFTIVGVICKTTPHCEHTATFAKSFHYRGAFNMSWPISFTNWKMVQHFFEQLRINVEKEQFCATIFEKSF